jgi:hypothetical protein
MFGDLGAGRIVGDQAPYPVPVALTTRKTIEKAMTIRCALAATGVLTSALIAASAALPSSATAHHVDGTRICERKFDRGDGQFFNIASDGIYTRRGRRVGRVSLNWRPRRRAGYHVQICAVTIRRTHRKPRFTSVLIRRYDDPKPKWRRDAGRYRLYAGPVVRRLHWSESIRGRARIGKAYCDIYVVFFPPGEFVPDAGTNCPGARPE